MREVYEYFCSNFCTFFAEISEKFFAEISALISAFIATAVLWIGIGAEFLGLALIFVYVGAVMALFLFIVFMLNIDVLNTVVSRRTKLLSFILITGVITLVFWKGFHNIFLNLCVFLVFDPCVLDLAYAQMQTHIVQILVNLKWFFGHNSAPRSRTELKMGGNSSQ